MSTTAQPGAELHSPAHWRVVDFIADLHLQASERATFDAWTHYLQATTADAVFILGDLFEAWVGDDAATEPGAFEAECGAVLRRSAQDRALYFMPGNRDFLLGPAFLQSCHVSALEDPTCLVFQQQRWLLSHGDALCLDDVDYLQFRALVRQTAWQQHFLAQPLGQRRALASQMRAHSEQRKNTPAPYADVDPGAARQWLQQARSNHLIHGHTHRPAQHDLGGGLLRSVLSDWDAAAATPRTEVLRLDRHGLQRIALAALAG